jgi:hypothetical protein
LQGVDSIIGYTGRGKSPAKAEYLSIGFSLGTYEIETVHGVCKKLFGGLLPHPVQYT